MPRPIPLVALFVTLTVAAGCDPVVSRRFDVHLTDRTKADSLEVTGQLADVLKITQDVAAQWNFEPLPPDQVTGSHNLGAWQRHDVSGVLSLWCRLDRHDRAAVWLTLGIASKESPTMGEIRRELQRRLVERFGADNVRLVAHWDKESLRR
jgi:hypothetical protein